MTGGFRDPATAKGSAGARGEAAVAWIASDAFRKLAATIWMRPCCQLGWWLISWAIPAFDDQDVYLARRAVTLRARWRWKLC